MQTVRQFVAGALATSLDFGSSAHAAGDVQQRLTHLGTDVLGIVFECSEQLWPGSWRFRWSACLPLRATDPNIGVECEVVRSPSAPRIRENPVRCYS